MGILDISSKDTTITYEFSLDQMRKLIAHDLGVSEDAVTVEYVINDTSDDRFGSYNWKCTEVRVTVKPGQS